MATKFSQKCSNERNMGLVRSTEISFNLIKFGWNRSLATLSTRQTLKTDQAPFIKSPKVLNTLHLDKIRFSFPNPANRITPFARNGFYNTGLIISTKTCSWLPGDRLIFLSFASCMVSVAEATSRLVGRSVKFVARRRTCFHSTPVTRARTSRQS